LLAWAVVDAAHFAWAVFDGLRAGGRMADIVEMMPLWAFPGQAIVFALACALLLALTWGARAGRRRRVLLWLPALVLALPAARNEALSLLAMVPGALEGLSSRREPSPRWRVALAFSPILVVALGVTVSALERDPPWGVGLVGDLFPRDAAAFVRDQRVQGPVFNTFETGGCLNWTWDGSPRTFIDGRALGGREHLAAMRAVLEGNLVVLDEQGICTVVIRTLYQGSGRLLPVVPALLYHPGWKLVRASDALVFVRATDSPGLPALSPVEGWRTVAWECEVLERTGRYAPHLPYNRARAAWMQGDADGARRWWAKALDEAPELAEAYRNIVPVH
jgi:hypothetical protein